MHSAVRDDLFRLGDCIIQFKIIHQRHNQRGHVEVYRDSFDTDTGQGFHGQAHYFHIRRRREIVAALAKTAVIADLLLMGGRETKN